MNTAAQQLQRRRPPPPRRAAERNDGSPFAALRSAAAWCVNARAELEARDLDAPPVAPVLRALASALADTTPASLDALGAALARWCRSAEQCDDVRALAPLALHALGAAGACAAAVFVDPPPRR